MPSPGTSPWVGFMPTTPLKDAGEISEPDVSVPMPTTVRPAATAAAVPLLDPPGEKSAPCGLTVCPPTALTPGVRDTTPASSERLFGYLSGLERPCERGDVGASNDIVDATSVLW